MLLMNLLDPWSDIDCSSAEIVSFLYRETLLYIPLQINGIRATRMLHMLHIVANLKNLGCLKYYQASIS